MLNVLENVTIMILLINRGLAGSVTQLKNADITHLNLIDMINTLSLIVIENLLENCNRYDLHELNNHIMKNSIEPLSIMFKNIDGVTSNFVFLALKSLPPMINYQL